MAEVDEIDMNILRGFIGECWADFVEYCANHEDDGGLEVANRIMVSLGGEPE